MSENGQSLNSTDFFKICNLANDLNDLVNAKYLEIFVSNYSIVSRYKIIFEKENFMHLLGLKPSQKLNSYANLTNTQGKKLFYDLALLNRLKLTDADSIHTIGNTRQKIIACNALSKISEIGGIFSDANKANHLTINADYFIAINNMLIALRKVDKNVCIPVSAQLTNRHKKVNLHNESKIIACKIVNSSIDFEFTYVNNSISKEQAQQVIASQLIPFHHFDVLENENQRRLLSRSMGILVTDKLIEKQKCTIHGSAS